MSVPGRLAIAGAVASLLAAATLAPLVQGSGWFVAVIAVIAVVAGVGAGARQLIPWWPPVVALQLLGLGLCLTWLFARDAAVWGLIPGPGVVGELGNLLRTGAAATRQQIPPVEGTRATILVVSGGIGLVALVVDLIAVSLRRPAVAGLPLLAVYCVPATVLPGGLGWWWFVPAAAGYLVLVGADSVDRIRAWGRVLGPAGDADGERALGGPLAGARRLAVGCVVVAAFLPALVPGLGERLLGGDSGRGTGRNGVITVINPILTLRDNLTARSNVVVIRYTTTAGQPDPLKIVSDDSFDGNLWSPSKASIQRDNRVQDGLPTAPGLTSVIPRQQQQTKIQTLDLRQTYLPVPYPPTRVAVEGPWIYDQRTLNIVGDGVFTQNLSYTVDHLAVEPTPDELRTAGPAPQPVLQAYGTLPATLPKVVSDTARRVVGSAPSQYEQAMALQEWFRSTGGFVYSTTVDPPRGKDASSQDAVAAFLRNKRGYCVQFASAMAVMARTLQIPSRVAVGFLPGAQRADGTYEVTVRDAHAWPELYFSNVGWVRFEPTPSTRAGSPPAWAVLRSQATATATTTVTDTAQPSPSVTAPQARPTHEVAPAAAQPPLAQRVLGAVPWRWLGLLVLLVLVTGIPLAIAMSVRRARWRRVAHEPPAARVEAAWDELRERLEDLGVRWAASWTTRALQLRLVTDYTLAGSAQAALGRLVADLEHARYAPPDGQAREADQLQADVITVTQAVAASDKIEPWTRRRARWLPASGLRALGGTVRRLDVAADEAGRRAREFGDGVRRRVGRR